MAKLPTTLGDGATPSARRAVQGYDSQAGKVDYGMASAALANYGRSVEGLGEAQAGVGKAVNEFGTAIAKREDKDAILAAQARENDFQKNSLSYLYDPENGVLNKQGKDALGLAGSTKEWVQKQRDTALDGVTNRQAQIALGRSLDTMQNSLMETVMRHESDQRKGYAAGLAQTQADNARDAVGLQYNDDKLFDGSKAQTMAAVAAQAKILGLPPETIAVNQRKAVSNLWTTRIKMAMNSTDPNAIAMGGAYYDRAAKMGELSFEDQVDLGHSLKTILPKAQAQAAFQKDYATSSSQNVTVDALAQAMSGAESSGMQMNGPGSVAGPGAPTTSPKGAIGNMQIMPDTGPEAAKLAGLPWDPELFNDPGPRGAAYNDALGKAYLGDMMARFNDPRLAVAAYNMGPGWTDDLMNGTNKSGKNPKMTKTGADFDQFIAQAPAETQGYVARVIGDVATAAGPPVIDLAKAQDQAAGMPPDVADNYLSMVTAHNEQITAAQKQQQNDVLTKIQPLLEQTNGNISALPSDLLAAASKAGVLDKVRAYKGFTDEGFKNYLDMLDTDIFSAIDLSDTAVRLRLSSSDFNCYFKKQSDMVNNPGDAGMSRRVDEAVNYVFQAQLGSKLKGKMLVEGDPAQKNDSDDIVLQNKVLRFKSLVRSQIQDEYTRGGKVPSSAEIFKIADNVITNDVSVPGAGWFGTNVGNSKSTADVTLEDIPVYARQQIEQGLIKRNLPVTEASVLSKYIQSLLLNRE